MLIAHKVTSMSGETAIPSIKAESADAYLCVICQHCIASFQYWFLHSLKQPALCLFSHITACIQYFLNLNQTHLKSDGIAAAMFYSLDYCVGLQRVSR